MGFWGASVEFGGPGRIRTGARAREAGNSNSEGENRSPGGVVGRPAFERETAQHRTTERITGTNGVDEVDITWTASTDDVAVQGYLIHRDYQYLTYLSGAATTSYTDTTVVANQTYRYQVRAQDTSGNNSSASPT